MSDMIDRVAEALKPFFSGADKAYGEHKDAARAAITAMQGDPGHDITAALCQPTEDRSWAVNAWQVMIDAALRNHE